MSLFVLALVCHSNVFSMLSGKKKKKSVTTPPKPVRLQKFLNTVRSISFYRHNLYSS